MVSVGYLAFGHIQSHQCDDAAALGFRKSGWGHLWVGFAEDYLTSVLAEHEPALTSAIKRREGRSDSRIGLSITIEVLAQNG